MKNDKDLSMIEVYSWPTPNGHKVHIMLEECGLSYRAIPIDIGAGDQFKPDFLRISPNNKIPAIVDPQGPDGHPISMFESGAINAKAMTSHSFTLDDYETALDMFRKGTGRKLQIRPNDSESRVLL